jgi:hypothetical protein
VLGENGLNGVTNRIPGQADLLDDGRRDVDFSVANPFAREARGEITGHGGIVGGARQTAADVAVKGEESPGIGPLPLTGADGGDIGE